MDIVFIGCVEIGLKCLAQVIRDGWDVKAVFTLAKKYAARTSGFVDFSPLAKRHGIPVYKVKDVNDDVWVRTMQKIRPDLIIVCGWQRLLSPAILAIPPKGVVGFHSSLLPHYRGRAPVNWAIINGEKKTGVTMFYCDAKADSGAIISQKAFPITLRDTCATVYNKSAKAACALLTKYLPRIAKDRVLPLPNLSRRYRVWPKRTPEDGRIRWNAPALKIHNWIRALAKPYPGAFSYLDSRKYFIFHSRYEPRAKKVRARPGEIVEVGSRGGARRLLVMASDRPLWVWGIEGEKGMAGGFRKGQVFQ